MVRLHGSGGRPMSDQAKKERIHVQAWGRGDTGYRGMGENDISEVIRYMLKHYPIDTTKILLKGPSLGGIGSWVYGSMHPERFAGLNILYGAASGCDLENLHGLPILNQHGAVDRSVPIDFSRHAHSKLKSLGYPILHREYPEAGHWIKSTFPVRDWEFSLKKDLNPKKVVKVFHRSWPSAVA